MRFAVRPQEPVLHTLRHRDCNQSYEIKIQCGVNATPWLAHTRRPVHVGRGVQLGGVGWARVRGGGDTAAHAWHALVEPIFIVACNVVARDVKACLVEAILVVTALVKSITVEIEFVKAIPARHSQGSVSVTHTQARAVMIC